MHLFKCYIFQMLKVNSCRTARIDNEALFSVDVMEYLIKKGVSYRQAHDVVGKMVKECLNKNKKISELSINQLKDYSKSFKSFFTSLSFSLPASLIYTW